MVNTTVFDSYNDFLIYKYLDQHKRPITIININQCSQNWQE